MRARVYSSYVRIYARIKKSLNELAKLSLILNVDFKLQAPAPAPAACIVNSITMIKLDTI